MQAYTAGFAKIYNLRWGGFAQQVAPLLRRFYETTPVCLKNQTVLDLCCGTGHLAAYFLEAGYNVIGVDSSEAMLTYARERALPYLVSGQARFIQADASHFTLDARVGLALATYDALNHLENAEALKSCFGCVFPLLEEGGLFIFDLNTRAGLRRWNGVNLDDSSGDLLLITRGIYDEAGGKAWTKITGFLKEEGGLYSRFDETAFNTVFDLAWVKEALLEAGWKEVTFALSTDLAAPLAEPEKEGRVFVVARK